MGSADAGLQRLHARADVVRVGLLFGPSVLQKEPVVIERAGGLAGLFVLAGKVVMRGGVPRVDLERAAQAALRVRELAGGFLRQREVDQRIVGPGIDAERLARLR